MELSRIVADVPAVSPSCSRKRRASVADASTSLTNAVCTYYKGRQRDVGDGIIILFSTADSPDLPATADTTDMLYITPVSAIHHGYPSSGYYSLSATPSSYPSHSSYRSDYRQDLAAELAVSRAAREYAAAQARVEALRRQRAEQARMYELQREHYLHEVRRAEYLARLASLSGQRRQQFAPGRHQASPFRTSSDSAEDFAAHIQRAVERLVTTLSQPAESTQPPRPVAPVEVCSLRPCQSMKESLTMVAQVPQVRNEEVTIKDLLLRRLNAEQDVELRDLVQDLLAHITGTSSSSTSAQSASAQGKGKARENPAIPFPWTKPSENVAQPTNIHNEPAAPVTNADLHRTPALSLSETEAKELFAHRELRRQSLQAIDNIRGQLQAVRSSFTFPESLDVAPRSRSRSPSPVRDSDSESGSLPFTRRNKPVHVYEHALSGLLTQLDGVESNGDEEVRKRRREVVIEVEQALGDIDKLVASATPTEEQVVCESTLDSGEMQSADRAVEVPAPVEAAAGIEVPTTVEAPEAVGSPSLTPEPEPIEAVSVQEVSETQDADDTISTDQPHDNALLDVSTPEASVAEAPVDSDVEVADVPADLANSSAPEAATEPDAELDVVKGDEGSEQSAQVTSDHRSSQPDSENTSIGALEAQPFLLQSSPLQEDESHAKVKAQVKTSNEEDTEWEEAKAEEEGWSEIE